MKKIFNILLTILFTCLLFHINTQKINAASASISVSSSTSQIVVGKEFTVTVKISSSTSLGSWEWVINYNSKNFKLLSGTSYVVDYASNGSKKSASYTYRFKAIGTGTGTIGVKSYGAYAWNESKLSVSAGSKSVKVITQAQLEATYSKNNNLKSLSIDGLTLSPKFNKKTLEYTAEAEANTTKIKINATKEDSKATVSGTGTKEVSEGDNKFDITVTAQNGSSKTYTIIVKVTDPNPITVTDTLGNTLTVVKRESNLEAPDNYEKKKITIDNQTVPGFYSEINDITLVGLKDESGTINLYMYDNEYNKYTKYTEISLDKLIILPLKIDEEINKKYKKETITIADQTFDALIMTNPQFTIIHAQDLLTGTKDYYIYDTKLNTLITYDNTEEKESEETLTKYFNIIILLCGESLIIFIILIGILISKIRKNKRRKRKLQEVKKLEQEKKKKEIKEQENKKETKTNESKTKKETKKKTKEKSDMKKLDEL